jgi:hypothetical protein
MAPVDGGAMGPDSSPPACDDTVTEGRPPFHRRPALLRRDSVDTLDGCALERTAPAVWQPEHLLATAAAVGSQRRAASAVASVAGPLE